MIWTLLRRRALLAAAIAALSATTGCDALDVSDPTAIEDEDLRDATGAMLLHGDALRWFSRAVSRGAVSSGIFADEFLYDTPPEYAPLTEVEELLDRRESESLEAHFQAVDHLGSWVEARRAVAVALPKLRAYALAPAYLGELFAVRGYATLMIAESICPGFPLNDVLDYQPIYRGPFSADEGFAEALTDLDSAAVHSADSARILDLARVARGRALLGRGQFESAAAAVASVPTEYAYVAEFGTQTTGGFWNGLAEWGFGVDEVADFRRRSVADQEGGAGLDFVSAGDPRVQVMHNGTLYDGTPLYEIGKYPDNRAPITVASGIEARLIEAEAALNGGNAGWLSTLNALRTTCTDAVACPEPAPAGSGGVESLPPLADPGTPEARVDLVFRERAFWLFATGHRLGDLRRLVTHYGRNPESVFPSGPYRKGGTYASATSIPFAGDREAAFNPAITGCTSR